MKNYKKIIFPFLLMFFFEACQDFNSIEKNTQFSNTGKSNEASPPLELKFILADLIALFDPEFDVEYNNYSKFMFNGNPQMDSENQYLELKDYLQDIHDKIKSDSSEFLSTTINNKIEFLKQGVLSSIAIDKYDTDFYLDYIFNICHKLAFCIANPYGPSFDELQNDFLSNQVDISRIESAINTFKALLFNYSTEEKQKLIETINQIKINLNDRYYFIYIMDDLIKFLEDLDFLQKKADLTENELRFYLQVRTQDFGDLFDQIITFWTSLDSIFRSNENEQDKTQKFKTAKKNLINKLQEKLIAPKEITGIATGGTRTLDTPSQIKTFLSQQFALYQKMLTPTSILPYQLNNIRIDSINSYAFPTTFRRQDLDALGSISELLIEKRNRKNNFGYYKSLAAKYNNYPDYLKKVIDWYYLTKQGFISENREENPKLATLKFTKRTIKAFIAQADEAGTNNDKNGKLIEEINKTILANYPDFAPIPLPPNVSSEEEEKSNATKSKRKRLKEGFNKVFSKNRSSSRESK